MANVPPWIRHALDDVFKSREYQDAVKTGFWDSLLVPTALPGGPWLAVASGFGGAVPLREGHPLPYVQPPMMCCLVHYPDARRVWELRGQPLSWPAGGTPLPPAPDTGTPRAELEQAYYEALMRALELGAFADARPRELAAATDAVRAVRRTLDLAIHPLTRPHYSGVMATIDRWLAAAAH